MITDRSEMASRLQAPLTTQDLSPGQPSLVKLMREHQFGRIENMKVRSGQPILDQNAKVIRIARLAGQGGIADVAKREEFELKREVRALLNELARLQDGIVLRLEFRHGLPFSLEATMHCKMMTQS
jgi:hypothetical protein